MRDELMRLALSWKFQAIVPADFAYGKDSDCYCPEEDCLVPVTAKKVVNAHFAANKGGHVAGCPNEPKPKDKNARASSPKQRAAQAGTYPAPTLLGPSPVPPFKTAPPKDADLKALLRQVKNQPICYPGTLHEIVAAWPMMSQEDRRNTPLTIGHTTYTYETAFRSLPLGIHPMGNLPWNNAIMFCPVDIKALTNVHVIESRMHLDDGNHTLKLRLNLPKKDPSTKDVPPLAGLDATLFWHGPNPALVLNGTHSAFVLPRTNNLYSGAVVLPGHFA